MGYRNDKCLPLCLGCGFHWIISNCIDIDRRLICNERTECVLTNVVLSIALNPKLFISTSSWVSWHWWNNQMTTTIRRLIVQYSPVVSAVGSVTIILDNKYVYTTLKVCRCSYWESPSIRHHDKSGPIAGAAEISSHESNSHAMVYGCDHGDRDDRSACSSQTTERT